MPFEVIFYKASKFLDKGEIVLDYIIFFIVQYWKNIHSGWIVIFRLIKDMYQKKSATINEKIKKLYKYFMIIKILY